MSIELPEFEESDEPNQKEIIEQYSGIGLDLVLKSLIKDGFIKFTRKHFYDRILNKNNEETSKGIIELLGCCKNLLENRDKIRRGEVVILRGSIIQEEDRIRDEIGRCCDEISTFLR